MDKAQREKTYGILALAFGVLIFLKPDILAWLVGIYLIITGILSLAK